MFQDLLIGFVNTTREKINNVYSTLWHGMAKKGSHERKENEMLLKKCLLGLRENLFTSAKLLVAVIVVI